MALILVIFGLFGLLTRLWLVESKIKGYLAEDRLHISRILGYFFWGAMFLGFNVNVLTFISVAIFPGMFLAIFFFDLPYLINDYPKITPEQPKKWILLERLTLHSPPAIYGTLFYFGGTKLVFYFALFSPFIVAGGAIVVFGLFLLIDPRWTIKKDHPRGSIILRTMIIGLIGNIVVYLLFAVPRGQVSLY